MNKKRLWLYRSSVCTILILILFFIFVKAIIWPLALSRPKDDYKYQIRLQKHTYIYRFTSKYNQRFFDKIDYLLPPAFNILSIIMAVKLAKTPRIFEEKD